MDAMIRSGDTSSGPPVHGLPTMQRRVVALVDQYTRGTGEPCPARYLARRLSIHPTTIRDHLSALHRKGWLKTSGAPVVLARKIE